MPWSKTIQKQMGWFYRARKPTRKCDLVHSEGLPVYVKSVAFVLRETTELGDRKVPETSVSGYPPLAEQVGRTKRQVRRANAFRESDQTTLLGDGKPFTHNTCVLCRCGEGSDGSTQLYRRTQIWTRGQISKRANITAKR